MNTHRGTKLETGALLTLNFLLVVLSAGTAAGQQGMTKGEWRHYGGDRGATKYSNLDQISPSNIEELEIVWRWKSIDSPIAKRESLRTGHFKATPLMIGGVLYVSTPLSQVAAIDAGTGETIWVYDPESYGRGRPANSAFQHRGVEYWTDGSDARIIIATGTRQLIALNAKTGRPYPDFGVDGWVDLGKGLGRDIAERHLGFNSPPVVVRDTIVLGSVISDGPRTLRMPPGHIRGFDVRTGKQKWMFKTIPPPGELGNETWLNDSWKQTGNTNAWGPLAADEELGYAYVATGTPTNDYYGGHRPGNNLFAETLLCLDAETGRRIWHFQGVHHGLWDYDFPCAPNLIDVVRNGRTVKAVAQVSKQGYTYVFNRVTGEPLWPIVERPVPQTTVPGEWTSPTQPIPTKPPPFERQGITEDDLIDFTPELRAEAVKILARYVEGPLFTPPALIGENGKLGAISLPGGGGGANWGGAAVDPEFGTLYVESNTIVRSLGVREADPSRTEFRYVRGPPQYVDGPRGLPLVKPPYGRITAYDLNQGEILWQIPIGDGPRNHPAIKHLNLGPLGSIRHRGLSSGALLVTKTLLFASQARLELDGTPSKAGNFMRAFDKRTGKPVWTLKIDLPPRGAPMTYLHEGKQYIVVSAGGGVDAELLAFALR